MTARHASVLCLAIALSMPEGGGAQLPLRVLRALPDGPANPASVVTIIFDRPVAGMLESTPDPARAVHIEPALDARIEWRDPSTIRIVPRQPLAPGSRFTISVDTTLTGFGGARLAAWSMQLMVRGPQWLGSIPAFAGTGVVQLPVDGRLILSFSAAVDSALLERTVRLELAGGAGCGTFETVRYRISDDHPWSPSDRWELQRFRGVGDSLSRRFQRIVTLTPTHTLLEGCDGALVIPSLDSTGRSELRYHARTAPPFTLVTAACNFPFDCVLGGGLQLSFSASVRAESLARYVRFDPAEGIEQETWSGFQTNWNVQARLRPRSTVRVLVDSALTDADGRRITGPLARSVDIGDRYPYLSFRTGFVTLPHSIAPSLSIRHINVARVEVTALVIPRSSRAHALLSSPDDPAPRAFVRDTFRTIVELDAPDNEERVTKISLPDSLFSRSGALVAVWFRADRVRRNGASIAPERLVPPLPDFTAPRSIAYLQRTNLMVHAKVSDLAASVLVTDARTGRPVPNAVVSAREGGRDGGVVALARTDAGGLASLDLSRRREAAPPPEESFPGAYVGRYAQRTPLAIEVASGTDNAISPVVEGAELGESRTYDATPLRGASLQQPAWIRASLYSDRGIYRPGETIHLGAIVRALVRGRVLALPGRDSVRFRVHSYDGRSGPQVECDTVAPLSAFGMSGAEVGGAQYRPHSCRSPSTARRSLSSNHAPTAGKEHVSSATRSARVLLPDICSTHRCAARRSAGARPSRSHGRGSCRFRDSRRGSSSANRDGGADRPAPRRRRVPAWTRSMTADRCRFGSRPTSVASAEERASRPRRASPT
jgi:hypothetical protein